MRVWESGIVMARYLRLNKDSYAGKCVFELGSGTGIGALSLLKDSDVTHVAFSDYSKNVLNLLEPAAKAANNNYSLNLIDWTKHD